MSSLLCSGQEAVTLQPGEACVCDSVSRQVVLGVGLGGQGQARQGTLDLPFLQSVVILNCFTFTR